MSSNAPSIVSTKDVTLPTKGELLKAMQVADSSEGARYLSTRVQEIVSKSRYLNKSPELMKTAKEVVKAVDEFADFVEFKHASRSKIWSGQLPETSNFKNMQKGIAQQAVNELTEKSLKDVRFDFAISQDGHFIRGYASTGEEPPLDGGTVESLDKLFNAWLAEKYQIATEDGYLFKTDAAGNRTQQLSVNEVEELMADSAKDFKEYLQASGNIELIGRQREYPGEHRMEELKRAAQKAVEKVIEAEEIDAIEEEEARVGPAS